MVRKSIAVSTIVILLGIWLVVFDDVSAAKNWPSFPAQKRSFVEKLSANYGLGACSGKVNIAKQPSLNEIDDCFSSATLSGEEYFQAKDKNDEYIVMTYICSKEGFSGEVTYLFYRSSSFYQCIYGINPSGQAPTKFDDSKFAVSPPEPTLLVWLVSKVFALF